MELLLLVLPLTRRGEKGVRYARPWGLDPMAAAARALTFLGQQKHVVFFGGATSAVLEV